MKESLIDVDEAFFLVIETGFQTEFGND